MDTEYGIAVSGKGASDLLAESRELVRAFRGKCAGQWDYSGEDPRNDMRGFHVDKLSEDPADALFDDPSARRLPAYIERSDQILSNGARFYNDHGHPEYATPECASLFDIVTHDKAGERVVLGAARTRMEAVGPGSIQIYKNNTDFHNSSYGTHENYLLSRVLPFDDLLQGLLPFFATRILYAGAGKIGIEPQGDQGVYQISQRADFITEEASVDTLFRRPLVNTRDEAHANARKWRRLHVICGDSNMSEYATALKVGTTYVVAALLETGWKPPLRLNNPIQAVKELSRDSSYRWLVDVDGVGRTPGVDVQRTYLAAAIDRLSGRGSDTEWVLKEWEYVLNTLETDPLSLGDRLDWVAKRDLLTHYAESEGLRMSDDALKSIDLAYANIDPEDGLYYALQEAGAMVRMTDDAAIDVAVGHPPTNTRAAIRGALVSRFPTAVATVGWNKVVLRIGEQSWRVDLDDCVDAESVQPVLRHILDSAGVADFLSAVGAKSS